MAQQRDTHWLIKRGKWLGVNYPNCTKPWGWTDMSACEPCYMKAIVLKKNIKFITWLWRYWKFCLFMDVFSWVFPLCVFLFNYYSYCDICFTEHFRFLMNIVIGMPHLFPGLPCIIYYRCFLTLLFLHFSLEPFCVVVHICSKPSFFFYLLPLCFSSAPSVWHRSLGAKQEFYWTACIEPVCSSFFHSAQSLWHDAQCVGGREESQLLSTSCCRGVAGKVTQALQ